MSRNFARGLLVSALLFLALPVPAQAGRRVALVVGNGAYASSPLKNPVNDATDVAAALKKLGFAVTLATDANVEAMLKALDAFATGLRGAEAGVFYFAGHGVQVEGQNYLLPVGAHVTSESDVEYSSVAAGRVLGKMEEAGARVNVVILDACRDNPFKRSFRSASRGLAVMLAGRGAFIAYATSPGSVSADGSGRNGVFTKHLLADIAVPGLSIEELFKRVTTGVYAETGQKQLPWVSSSLMASFSFVGGVKAATPTAAAQAAPATSAAVELSPLAAGETWDESVPGNDAAALLLGKARKAYRQGRYIDAQALLEEFLTRHPWHSLASQALFWRGVSLLRASRPWEGRIVLQTVLGRHPGTEEARRAQALLDALPEKTEQTRPARPAPAAQSTRIARPQPEQTRPAAPSRPSPPQREQPRPGPDRPGSQDWPRQP